ncbi:hypothetical protein J4Q44_G00069810 [Coregonus suidteri]|uniref:Uncharacterized protein n=1 Tax=Coregonus suidteri TaxID=861788 RepID=A0AAN8R2M4_9TELE
MDNSEPESEMPPLLQEDQCSTTGRESPIVQEDVKHDRSSTVEIETEKTELAKEDSAVGDSGSSSGQTEEGSSGKDLSTSVSLQPPRVPAEGLGATSMSFTNGHRMEEVDIPGEPPQSRLSTSHNISASFLSKLACFKYIYFPFMHSFKYENSCHDRMCSLPCYCWAVFASLLCTQHK